MFAESLLALTLSQASPETPWQLDPIWDDGQAEVSIFAASEPFYDISRDFEATLIVVKEDIAKDLLVKADSRPPGESIPVMKENLILAVQTGMYSYHQMASLFFRRSDLGLVKMTASSQEWCGQTFKEWTVRDGKGLFESRSYWDGEADRSFRLDARVDDLPSDGLPVALRGVRLAAGSSRSVRLLPPQLSPHAPEPELEPATLRGAGPVRVDVPAGSFDCRRIEVVRPDAGVEVLDFASDAPHQLVRWKRSSGGDYRLRLSKRISYWKKNAPGDEKLLVPGSGGG